MHMYSNENKQALCVYISIKKMVVVEKKLTVNHQNAINSIYL